MQQVQYQSVANLNFHKVQWAFEAGSERVKIRVWMLLLLMMHLVVHPLTHVFSASLSSPEPQSICSPAPNDLALTRTSDHCELCRLANSVSAAADEIRSERLSPQWISVSAGAVSYNPLNVASQLSSRAPPTL